MWLQYMYNRDRWLQVTTSELMWLLQTRTHYTQWLYLWLFYTIIQQPLCQTKQQLLLVACPLCHQPDSKFQQIWFCHVRLDSIFGNICIFIWFSNLFSCLSFYGIFRPRSQLTNTLHEHCLFEMSDGNKSSTSYIVVEQQDSPHVGI